MPSVQIQDYNVDFPFDPYPCQVDYMDNAIRAILSSTNALLESPTGTGKTLCLLCSTLAWQSKNKIAKVPIVLQYSSGTSNPNPPKRTQESSVIIYASRTHTQLSQVVSELRTTSYRPKTAVLGSREQLCVHEKISKLRGGSMNHACNSMNSQHKCMYKNNLDHYNGAKEGVGSAPSPILDIEQLATLGRTDKICPYFYSRDNSTDADLVLVPYNYLLDKSIRATLKIEWKNAIVIFDEAHNLERVASDAASIVLTSSDIAMCVSELQQVIKILKLQNDEMSQIQKLQQKKNETPKSADLLSSSTGPSLTSVVVLLKALFEAERRFDDIPLSNHGPGKKPCSVLPGSWLIEMLHASGFHSEKSINYAIDLQQCSELLLEEAQKALGQSSSVSPTEPKLSMLSKLLSRVFRGRTKVDSLSLVTDYKVFICEEDITAAPATTTNGIKILNNTNRKKRVLNFWCFSPGIAMEDMKRLGVRSVIVTSGTLSPMESFRDDLKLPFPLMLENPHVISNHQLFVGAVSMGPNNTKLNSSYAGRDSPEYKDDLGFSILQICQTMNGNGAAGRVPPGPELKGGILVFFPSYTLMESAVARWTTTGMINILKEAVGGGIVMEPKGGSSKGTTNTRTTSHSRAYNTSNASSSNTNVVSHFGYPATHSKANTFDSNDGEEVENSSAVLGGVVAEFEAAMRSSGKCLLLAVCRGKVSEGIDFKDAKGRVAIITGIPFAPPYDPWVALKKQYLDEKCSRGMVLNTSENLLKSQIITKPTSSLGIDNKSVTNNNATTTNGSRNPPSKLLDGQGWYVQSASRAVNQALGRVIRHRKDWGAVFLLDERFQADRQISQLSGWVRPKLRKYTNYANALTDFRSFITTAMRSPDLIVKEAEVVPRISRIVPESLRSRDSDADYTGESTVGDFARRIVLSVDKIQRENITTEAYDDEGNVISNITNNNSDNNDGVNGGIYYVDPKFLMSQVTSENVTSGSSSRRGFGLTTGQSSGNNHDNDNYNHNLEADKGLSLNEIIQNMKQQQQQYPVINSSIGNSINKPKESLQLFGTTSTTSTTTLDNEKVNTSSTATSSSLKSLGRSSTMASYLNTNLLAEKRRLSDKIQTITNTSSMENFLIKKSNSTGSATSTSSTTVGEKTTHGLKAQQTHKYGIKNLFGEIKSSQVDTQKNSQELFKSSATPFVIIPTAITPTPTIATTSTTINHVDSETALKAIIVDLRKRISSQDFQTLKTLITSTKTNGGIVHITQLRDFSDSLISCLLSLGIEKSPTGAEETVLKFLNIIPLKFQSSFQGIVRKYFTDLRSQQIVPSVKIITTNKENKENFIKENKNLFTVNNSKELLLPPPPGTLTTVTKINKKPNPSTQPLNNNNNIKIDIDKKETITQDNFSQKLTIEQFLSQSDSYSLTQDVDNSSNNLTQQNSKRARLMLAQAGAKIISEKDNNSNNNSKSNSNSSVKSTSNSVLAQLHNIKLKVVSENTSSENITNQLESKATSALFCPICLESSGEHYAAKECGHICCRTCWQHWLKVNKCCPMCRAPTNTKDVTRIIIK